MGGPASRRLARLRAWRIAFDAKPAPHFRFRRQ